MRVERHFVTFYSPGTFCAETTTQEIHAWDTVEALSRAKSVEERYGARPYAFRFSTRAREDHELDSKVVAESGYYFFGCNVLTVADVKAKYDRDYSALVSNMECNGWDRVASPREGWRWHQPVTADDVVLEEPTNSAREIPAIGGASCSHAEGETEVR